MGTLFELKLFDVTIDDTPARDAIASGMICWRHPSRLMAIELPTSLIRFIRASVPTYQAAEVLLLLAAHPERIFTPEELVVSMRPAVFVCGCLRPAMRLGHEPVQGPAVCDRDPVQPGLHRAALPRI
jgi:hypothetical protein